MASCLFIPVAMIDKRKRLRRRAVASRTHNHPVASWRHCGAQPRRDSPRWHLDEVFVKVNGSLEQVNLLASRAASRII
jgi:hypothetical protein